MPAKPLGPDETPMFWRQILIAVTFGKAAIAGAGLAIAALGAFDAAAAVAAQDWLTGVKHAYALDAVATTGGVAGILFRIFVR